MITITEDYVSFETAKLLKEKGFGVDCLSMYVTPKPHSGMGNPNKAKLAPHGKDSHYYEGYIYQCEAPTQQMAMRWLREVHNLHIITIPYAPMDRHPYHPGEADIVYIAQLFRGIIPIDEIGRSIIKLTHEEAVEAAIKYSLKNLI